MDAKDYYIELMAHGITPTEQDLLAWMDEEMEMAESMKAMHEDCLEKEGEQWTKPSPPS